MITDVLKPETTDKPIQIKLVSLIGDDGLTKMSLRDLEKEFDKAMDEVPTTNKQKKVKPEKNTGPDALPIDLRPLTEIKPA
jgi:hypothetical protein